MSVLFILITISHYQMYFNLWPSETATRTTFSKKYTLLETELSQDGGKCTVVNASESIRTLASRGDKECSVTFTTAVPAFVGQNERIIVSARNPLSSLPPNTVARPLVDELKNFSLHWWVISRE